MAKKSRKSRILNEIRAACASEEAAVEFLEAQRFSPEGSCPRCGSTNVYTIKDRDAPQFRERHYRWRCRDCRRMFSVRTGTVMEESRLPLRVWLHAFWRACSSKKGVSALQISRECEISYKSALFLMHRIRYAMETDHGSEPKLQGTVEVDETFIGGKPRHSLAMRRLRSDPTAPVTASEKIPVVGLVERSGSVRIRRIERVDAKSLRGAVVELVEPGSEVHTDENPSYKILKRGYRHRSVNHSRSEYVRGDVSTNAIEGVFSLIKRGVYGTFHSVSKHHLPRYLAEFEFRYNTRGADDGNRTLLAISGSEGKRLLYKRPEA